MDNVTIGQIAIDLALIAGIIGSCGVILGVVTKVWKNLRKKEINPVLEEMANMEARIMTKMNEQDEAINERISGLSGDLEELDIGQCKNYLVRYIASVERGDHLDTSETERAYEVMDRYTDVLHQNSYIHKRWVEVVEKQEIK